METVKAIIKLSGFKKASPETRITAILSQLKSTHDAIFVFKKKKFLGVINLYHSLLGKKTNSQEKAESCLYHPPVLLLTDSLIKVAQLMVESRLYRLPVLKGDNFLGVVFAEDILNWAKSKGFLNGSIKENLKLRKPFFIDGKSSINQAIHLMIDNRTNRLLVTDKQERILGLLSLYDLRRFFTKPSERISFLMRAPIKKEFVNQQISGLYHYPVIFLLGSDSVSKGVETIIKNKIGSLVIFPDLKKKKVSGLITLRDLLQFIAELKKQREQISLSRDFSKQKLKLAKKVVFKKIGFLLNNPLFSSQVERINLSLREIAKSGQEVRLPLMEVTALIRLKRGNQWLRAKVKGRRLAFMADEMVNKLKTIVRKRKERHD